MNDIVSFTPLYGAQYRAGSPGMLHKTYSTAPGGSSRCTRRRQDEGTTTLGAPTRYAERAVSAKF